MRRPLALAAVSALALATGLAVLPPATAAPAPAADPAPTTTITFRVTGCEGCVLLGATVSGTDQDPTYYNAPKAKVRGGVATVTVPTAQTRGMVFGIDAPWKVMINAQPTLVFQYQGQEPGTRTTVAAARAAKRASVCWAGTTGATAELRVRVARVTMPAFDPDSPPHTTQVPLAWVVPTQAALTPFYKTYRGVIGLQDGVLCGTS